MEETRKTDSQSGKSDTRLTLFDRYQEHLTSLPSPGGNRCHTALLGVANLGILYVFFLNGRNPEADSPVRLALEDFRAERIMRRGQK